MFKSYGKLDPEIKFFFAETARVCGCIVIVAFLGRSITRAVGAQ